MHRPSLLTTNPGAGGRTQCAWCTVTAAYQLAEVIDGETARGGRAQPRAELCPSVGHHACHDNVIVIVDLVVRGGTRRGVCNIMTALAYSVT